MNTVFSALRYPPLTLRRSSFETVHRTVSFTNGCGLVNHLLPVLRSDGDLNPVGGLAADDLARQPRIGFHRQRHVEHVHFAFGRRGKFIVPAVIHIDMAGGAGAGAAAFRRDVQPAIAQDFHHTPAVAAFQRVFLALTVNSDNLHETPSFFCRLDEEVVYWKRSFSFGLTI